MFADTGRQEKEAKGTPNSRAPEEKALVPGNLWKRLDTKIRHRRIIPENTALPI